MKCGIPNCPNKSHQGTFIGNFCSPCYNTLKHGNFKNNSTLAKNLEDLKDKIMMMIIDFWRDAEMKYKE